MTPSGIEPATFRFVAQHLNHCATANLNFNSEENSEKIEEANLLSFLIKILWSPKIGNSELEETCVWQNLGVSLQGAFRSEFLKHS